MPARAARRTADAVFAHLQTAIVSGELAPGEKIDPEAVGELLDVSRTPIREALLRLEADGLVERVPYRGAIVRGVDLRLAEETAAVRLHLEGLAVRLAMARLTDATLDAMAATLDDLARLEADPGYEPEEWNRLNDRFHGALYEAAACPSLTKPLQALNAQAARIRIHFDVRRGPAAKDHRAILAACRSGDPERAARAAQLHILHTHLRLTGGEDVDPASALGAAAALAGIALRDEHGV
ncbi:MAG TPA: GntR family transcriptional regulator [Solirubrobacteraceae bacterium]|nr:GntR family transcriptional regulator [Solirubrobacteraceae bacterium]